MSNMLFLSIAPHWRREVFLFFMLTGMDEGENRSGL
jgi:hypothetical protein